MESQLQLVTSSGVARSLAGDPRQGVYPSHSASSLWLLVPTSRPWKYKIGGRGVAERRWRWTSAKERLLATDVGALNVLTPQWACRRSSRCQIR
ncbi:hypothetical protein EVAR_14744_1 [Eumeta japonica]|uniref:Uncharacterized protein n=1 Tax=Eumeta variegata TaxID=151549 RepID=A0A4C1TWC2_EUMVA|nr:hypothetical protein EVAR_14744_1 [Eumeta japonica]